MAIDVISDLVCPWCWVGKHKLERALAERPDLADEIILHPFELDPGVPPEGVPYRKRLATKFGSELMVERAWERLRAIGAELGITFNFDRIELAANSLDAHRVLGWALDQGGPALQAQLAERLYAAHFRDGERIDHADVLAAHAGVVGMDQESVQRRLGTDSDRLRVQDDVIQAQRMGVTGVPTFIFAGRLAVSGAQDPKVLIRAMEQAKAA